MEEIGNRHLSFVEIDNIIGNKKQIKLSAEASREIVHCFHYLQHRIKSSDAPVYGINTGFGSLYNTSIEKKDLSTLQENLVRSHACGMGDEVPAEIVKLMLLLKIQGLSYGKSGVAVETVQRLVDMFNHDVLPVIYQQGSLGASGDLAPLAHLSLPLIGEGEVYYKGEKKHSSEVLKTLGWQPLQLQAKEGLALLNGTQFMSAYATWCVMKANKLSGTADITGAISLEAFDGRIEPFNQSIQKIRPHNGQINTGKHFRELLEGSEMIQSAKKHVQDPYSFRCIPQVHGATKDAINYVSKVVETEINSVTDNPTIFPEEDLVISAGNFHGQPLALALDFLCIAVAELASISERRIYKLISGQRDLPPFLVKNPGLNSGFMIPQYTAASIISQNKQLCTPASVDTIDSSNGQEDHVSMGANAATKCYRVVLNLEKVLGIELLNAAQAIEFRRPKKSSIFIEKILSDFRKEIPFVENDVYMHDQMMKAITFIRKL